MLFKNSVSTLNFFAQSSFGSHPLQSYLILEVECIALFCKDSGSLEVVLLLGVAKQLFQGMLIGHRLFSCSIELLGVTLVDFRERVEGSRPQASYQNVLSTKDAFRRDCATLKERAKLHDTDPTSFTRTISLSRQ